MRKLLGALAILFAVAGPSTAQDRRPAPSATANPQLTALYRGIQHESRGRPLDLSPDARGQKLLGRLVVAKAAGPGRPARSK